MIQLSICGDETMAPLYILIFEFANQGEVMLVRRYGKKYGAGGFLFNGIICLFAMIFFLVTDKGGLYFAPGLWKYGAANAVLYGSGFYFAYLAYRVGPYLLTHTITGLNFIFPIFYGLFFLNESANYMTYLALACTFISFFLMVYGKPKKQEQKKGFSFLWLIATIITLLSNGFISILNKTQQAAFNNQYTNEYMVITLSGATFFLLLLGFITERKNLKTLLKGGAYGMGAGLLNGAKNFANLAAMMIVPLTILTPVKMAIAKPLNFCVSFFIYKERYTILQYLSIGFGILSVVLMQVAKYV